MHTGHKETPEEKKRIAELFTLAKQQECQNRDTLNAIIHCIRRRISKYPTYSADMWEALPKAIMTYDASQGAHQLTHWINCARFLGCELTKASLTTGSVYVTKCEMQRIKKTKGEYAHALDPVACVQTGQDPESLLQYLHRHFESL